MKAIYYSLVISLLMAFNLPAQTDTNQLIKVKNFRVSFEYEDVFVNNYGVKDTSTETETLTECQSVQVYQDSLLVIYHNKGKEIIPFIKITGLEFPSRNDKMITGVTLGAVTGAALAVATTFILAGTSHGEDKMGAGYFFIIGTPIMAIVGAITGAVLSPNLKSYVNHDLENIPPEKRKEKVLKLLIERSKR